MRINIFNQLNANKIINLESIIVLNKIFKHTELKGEYYRLMSNYNVSDETEHKHFLQVYCSYLKLIIRNYSK